MTSSDGAESLDRSKTPVSHDFPAFAACGYFVESPIPFLAPGARSEGAYGGDKLGKVMTDTEVSPQIIGQFSVADVSYI